MVAYSIRKSIRLHSRINLLALSSFPLKIAVVLPGDELWNKRVYISGADDEEDGEKRTAIRPPLLARGLGPHMVIL